MAQLGDLDLGMAWGEHSVVTLFVVCPYCDEHLLILDGIKLETARAHVMAHVRAAAAQSVT